MIQPLDKCLWKYMSELFGEQLTFEMPEYDKCEDCSGMTNKPCYYPLKLELKRHLKRKYV